MTCDKCGVRGAELHPIPLSKAMVCAHDLWRISPAFAKALGCTCAGCKIERRHSRRPQRAKASTP